MSFSSFFPSVGWSTSMILGPLGLGISRSPTISPKLFPPLECLASFSKVWKFWEPPRWRRREKPLCWVRETTGQLSWRFHGMTEAFGDLWKIIIFNGKIYYLLIYFFPFFLVKRDMTPSNFASKQECPAWGLGPCGGDRTPFAPQWAIWVGWSKILTQKFVNSQRQTMNWREATSKSYPCDFLTGESPAMAPVICGRTSGSTWPISSPWQSSWCIAVYSGSACWLLDTTSKGAVDVMRFHFGYLYTQYILRLEVISPLFFVVIFL